MSAGQAATSGGRVPSANRRSRARSRKRARRALDAQAGADAGARAAPPGRNAGARSASAASERPPRRESRRETKNARKRSGASHDARAATGIVGSARALGERPPAPWHPLPLSEILILVGAVAAVIGLSDGAHATLLVGVGAVVLGTGEVTVREHLSGYRSHALVLAVLPVVVIDTAVAFAVAAVINPVPVALKVGVLVLDVPLLAFLYRLLRDRFVAARRERVFSGAR